MLGAGEIGQHDGGHAGRLAMDLFEHADAAAALQLDVQHGNVRLQAQDALDSLVGVVGVADDIDALDLRQHLQQPLPHDRESSTTNTRIADTTRCTID